MKKSILIIFVVIVCALFANVYGQNKDSLNADDILNMSFSDLMNTQVISASKVQQQIKDVAATTQVITGQQIRERNYFTLEEALSDLPGFQFRNINGYNSYVFMRGATSQNNLILVLIDGVQINELNSGGFYGGGQFNLSDVERIEVVYGPSSALYGTNAISGIINIITKDPVGKHKGQVSLLAGNFKTGLFDFNLMNYSKEKDFGYYLSGMYKSSEKADLRSEKGDFNWTDEMENFERDLSLSAKVKHKKFTAALVYQEKQSSMSTTYRSSEGIYLDKNTIWDIAFLNGFLKYSNNKTDRLSFNSMLYYRNATIKPNTIGDILLATDTTNGNQIGYYRPNQLIGSENQLNFNVSRRIMIIGGIVGEFEQLSDGFSFSNSNSQFLSPPTPSKPDILNNFLFSYYVQANIKIFSTLSIVGGLRHDFSNYYGQVFTPRTGLIFSKGRLTSKLSYNSAFRAPKPWDYKYGLGNNNLSPERMHSFELFCSYSINEHFSLGSSFYKNQIDNKLMKESLPNGNRWINKNELNTNGIELYANFSAKAFSVFTNYTYSDSYDQDEVFIPEISMHTANAGITYSFISNLKINLRSNFLGQRKNPAVIQTTGNNIIDDALLFHGCISYSGFKSFDIQLKVNNILNTEYYHPSNLFAGRYRQAQRTYSVKISYKFGKA